MFSWFWSENCFTTVLISYLNESKLLANRETKRIIIIYKNCLGQVYTFLKAKELGDIPKTPK